MTYSIVARDPATGELGVAVQSHAFSVGSVVPWARPGVGAVATQSMSRIDYGPRGLELMEGGLAPSEALSLLVGQDEGSATRQVAMVSAAGQTASWTGEACIAVAGDVRGDGVSCQANIMATDGVPKAMLAAFEAGGGQPLARRLASTLHAAQALGGDLRGQQSAAVLVVPASGDWWETVVVLNVEDHPDPLGELDRLLDLNDAYGVANDADQAAAAGDFAAALDGYRRALQLAQAAEAGSLADRELQFWTAVGAAQAGDEATALQQLRTIIAADPAWRELLARLPDRLAPTAQRLLEQL